MTRLRTISTGRLLALCAVALVALAGLAAIAVAGSGTGPTPPPKPLAQALRDAAAGTAPQGVSARVRFTNTLIDASGLATGTNPLLAGANGRLWISAGGDLRLELQSQGGGGDAQVVLRGDELTVYDSSANTLYRATLPPEPTGREHEDDAVPALATVERALARLARVATVGEATPANIAGREAYTVRLAPRRDGGLVGGASLAWDAANGAPLRVAVYSTQRSDPVLELVATDVDFGPVEAATFAAPAPPGATVVNLSPKAPADHAGREHTDPVTGLDAVRERVGFPLAAPATLAGMERSQVALIDGEDRDGALVTYGRGLGGLAVLQLPVRPGEDDPADGGRDGGIASVDLGDGVRATQLETPLGTGLTFTRDGVRVVVLGSVTADVAQAAARGLR